MIFQAAVDAVTKILTDIIGFLPHLMNGIIILAVGYLIARLAGAGTHLALRKANFDGVLERIGISRTLRDLGIQVELARVVSQAVFMMLALSFFITGTREIGLDPVARVLESIVALFPNLIGAIIVLMIGGIAARLLADAVAGMASGAGLEYGRRLGVLVRSLVMIFVAILALGVLGLDIAILVTALTIFIAAFGLAIGLGLGLGSRAVVQHILAGYYVRQRYPAGESIGFDSVQGQVSDIGSVNTRISTTDGTIVVPNALLLESLVRSGQPSDAAGRADAGT